MTSYNEDAKLLTFKQFSHLFESHKPHCFYEGKEKEDSLVAEWEKLTGKSLKKELKKEGE